MNKETYFERLDQVNKHINYEIEKADNNAKRYTVDVAKYLHSEDPTDIDIRENAYLNYKVYEGQKVILTQIREDIRRILIANVRDDFKV